MTREEACAKIEESVNSFQLEGCVESCQAYGSGHINDTFLLKMKADNQITSYILQRMNHEIFTKPEELVENISSVTKFLRKKIIKLGGNPNRETLNLVAAKDGKYYYKDSIGSYWRIYLFIGNTNCFDLVRNERDFYQSAVAFGRFQNLLANYPAKTLHETIVDFHNTKSRFRALKTAIEADILGRAQEVRKEIDFAYTHEHIANGLVDMLEKNELPLRVTHNDTKLNNILMDAETGKALCIIDLDTVMPGLSAYDFGDSIRYGASTAAEDETDLSKVSCNMKLFEVFAKGYIEGCNHALTENEIRVLPLGALTMTYECAIRFLTDYLQGDTYFKIHREKQNLDRCRTQFKLVKDMESKWSEMNIIVSHY